MTAAATLTAACGLAQGHRSPLNYPWLFTELRAGALQSRTNL